MSEWREDTRSDFEKYESRQAATGPDKHVKPSTKVSADWSECARRSPATYMSRVKMNTFKRKAPKAQVTESGLQYYGTPRLVKKVKTVPAKCPKGHFLLPREIQQETCNKCLNSARKAALKSSGLLDRKVRPVPPTPLWKRYGYSLKDWKSLDASTKLRLLTSSQSDRN